MHTIFRIGQTEELNDQFSQVNLTLTDDNDQLLKELTHSIQNRIGGGTAWH